MEDALALFKYPDGPRESVVLILVLMEDALAHQPQCCSWLKELYVLILVLMEDALVQHKNRRYKVIGNVLILVLMEDALVLYITLH